MKNLLLSISFLFTLITMSMANSTTTYCTWDAWMDNIRCGNKYDAKDYFYLRAEAKKHHDLQYIELYINGYAVRKEYNAPYEWGKNGGGDHYLRNLKPGHYKLKLKIKDKCGKINYKYCDFYIKDHYSPPTNGGHCDYYSLNWIKDIKHKYPYHSICEYTYNHKTYYKVYKCGVSHYTEYWYNCSGHLVCKFQNGNPCHEVRYAKKVKCWYDGCKNTRGHKPPTVTCDYKAWFGYPNKQYYSKGSRVYVKVEAQNYHDIKYMKLYLNGKLIRQENNYPYEWGKNGGSDHYLYNMHTGHYKLMVEIKDKCGKTNYKYREFIVKNGY